MTEIPTSAFVTGGSGFIGGALVRRLAAGGCRVAALARSERSAAAVAALGAEPVRGDLDDVGAMTAGARGPRSPSISPHSSPSGAAERTFAAATSRARATHSRPAPRPASSASSTAAPRRRSSPASPSSTRTRPPPFAPTHPRSTQRPRPRPSGSSVRRPARGSRQWSSGRASSGERATPPSCRRSSRPRRRALCLGCRRHASHLDHARRQCCRRARARGRSRAPG